MVAANLLTVSKPQRLSGSVFRVELIPALHMSTFDLVRLTQLVLSFQGSTTFSGSFLLKPSLARKCFILFTAGAFYDPTPNSHRYRIPGYSRLSTSNALSLANERLS